MTGYRVVHEGLLQTERLNLNHVRVAPYTRAGGRVLFLGGSNFDLRLKRDFLHSPLVAACETATFEPRGIGHSAQPPGPWRMADYAHDALAYLDALGWGDVDIIAESFGGMTALHLALIAPHRVRRMALISTTSGGKGGRSFDLLEFLKLPRRDAARAALKLQDRAMVAMEQDQPEQFAKTLERRIDFETRFMDPSILSGGYKKLLQARAAHDVWDQIANLNLPIRVIAGTRDGQAPETAQRAMANRLPQSSFVSYDAGHGLCFACPLVIPDILKSWYGIRPVREPLVQSTASHRTMAGRR